MFEYVIGKINYLSSNYLIIENNFMGYKICISNPEKFELNKFQRIYLYVEMIQNHENNFCFKYYGFKNLNERLFFENLLTVNGISHWRALNILKNDVQLIKNLIKNNDVASLEALDGFNEQIAKNVVFCLSNKITTESNVISSKNNTNALFEEAIVALRSLGYKENEIEKAFSEIDKNQFNSDSDISDVISTIIKAILANDCLSDNS